MSKYGKCATESAKLILLDPAVNPRKAWQITSSRIFGRGTSSQRKGCPKDAFLGLCEVGLVKDIPGGSYTRSVKNKRYSIVAVAKLEEKPDFASDWKALWRLASGPEKKQHNGQMDVVLSLWKNGFIEKRNLPMALKWLSNHSPEATGDAAAIASKVV